MKPIQVAVAAPVRDLYTYCAPDDLNVVVGHLVEVPFGKSQKRAVVCSVNCQAPEQVELKELLRIVDPVPVFGQALLKTIRWAADYYLVPPGEMIFAALPPVHRKSGRKIGPKSELWVVALGGLENQLDSPAKSVLVLSQHRGDPQSNCEMSVVSTRMHKPISLGPIGHVILLLQWQGIHVKAEQDDWARSGSG